jgi:hypothetical protein
MRVAFVTCNGSCGAKPQLRTNLKRWAVSIDEMFIRYDDCAFAWVLSFCAILAAIFEAPRQSTSPNSVIPDCSVAKCITTGGDSDHSFSQIQVSNCIRTRDAFRINQDLGTQGTGS